MSAGAQGLPKWLRDELFKARCTHFNKMDYSGNEAAQQVCDDIEKAALAAATQEQGTFDAKMLSEEAYNRIFAMYYSHGSCAADLQPYIERAYAAGQSVASLNEEQAQELTRIILNTNWKRTGQCDNRHVALTNGQWQAIASRALKLNEALRSQGQLAPTIAEIARFAANWCDRNVSLQRVGTQIERDILGHYVAEPSVRQSAETKP